MTTPTEREPRPAWPLFTVAALSFVPILGIFFGGAGATWGLVSSRRRALWAALLAMTGAIVNMVGIVAFTFATAGKAGGMSKMQAETAQLDLRKLVVEIDTYHAMRNQYPATLAALRQGTGRLNTAGLYDQSGGVFRMPREYTYRLAADGESYDLFGVGPDNVPGTADDVRPVLPDSLKAHSGFRPQPPSDHP